MRHLLVLLAAASESDVADEPVGLLLAGSLGFLTVLAAVLSLRKGRQPTGVWADHRRQQQDYRKNNSPKR